MADLLRPVDPIWHYLAADLGRFGFAALTRLAFPVLVGAIAFDLYVPARLGTYPLFVGSVLLATVICFACRYLVNATAYWLLDSRGPQIGWVAVSSALSGMAFPLAENHVRVCGLEPVPQRTRLARRIGVVFGQRSQLWWDLPLRESFELLRHVYRVPVLDHRTRLKRCRDLLDLDAFAETPVRQLSLGQRTRGELTAALLHGPEVQFLDEPTIGLDVVSKQAVRGFLAGLRDAGDTTVVLTTHDLADIERLCRRLVVIDHGRVVHDGTLERLHERYGSRRRVVVEPDIEDVVARLYGGA